MTEVARFECTVDAVGHRTKVVESIDGLGRTIEYEYDELYRLTREKVTGADAGLGGDYQIDYYFDLVGNRLRKVKDAVETEYVYNARDQLLTETTGGVTTYYGYDDNGSLTSKTTGTQADAFTYDVRNRMIAATVDGIDLEYAYDHDGERVRKIAYGQGPFEDDLEEHYLLDKRNPTGYSQVLQVFNVSFGMVTRTFIIGHRVLMHIGTSASSLQILVQDGHGSVRGLFNPSSGSNGAFVAGQVYAYDAFGVRLTQTQPGDPLLSSLLYAGEWWDHHLGRANHRGRWLIHPIARFDAFDVYEGRVGEPLTLHKYVYAHADPINNVDPSGRLSLLGALTATGIAGLATGILYTGLTWDSNDSFTERFLKFGKGFLVGSIAAASISVGIATGRGAEVVLSAVFSGLANVAVELVVPAVNPAVAMPSPSALAVIFGDGFSQGAFNAAFKGGGGWAIGLAGSFISSVMYQWIDAIGKGEPFELDQQVLGKAIASAVVSGIINGMIRIDMSRRLVDFPTRGAFETSADKVVDGLVALFPSIGIGAIIRHLTSDG